MALKIRKSKSASLPDQPVEEQKLDFWETETGTPVAVVEHKKLLSDQIVRLQQRQQELVEHTSKELEMLKMQLEDNNQVEELVQRAKEPLVDELRSMKEHLAQAEVEKKHLANELERIQKVYRDQYSQMQSTVDDLNTIVGNQAQAFNQAITPVAPAPIAPTPIQRVPEPVYVAPVIAPALVHEERLTKQEIPTPTQPDAFSLHEVMLKEDRHRKEQVREDRERRERKPFSARKFAIRAVSMGLILTAGTWGYKTIAAQQAASVASIVKQSQGQVAGASTDPGTIAANPTPDPYLESQADLPFAATVWETATDPDYGIIYDYPKNTSNRVRTDTNLFVIRKDSYLVKITRDTLPANGTLDTWQTANQDSMSSYRFAKGTFKGQPAWIGQAAKLGTVTVIKNQAQILEIYTPLITATTDDGKRQARILDSLQFTK
jgi:hypothetical protein